MGDRPDSYARYGYKGNGDRDDNRLVPSPCDCESCRKPISTFLCNECGQAPGYCVPGCGVPGYIVPHIIAPGFLVTIKIPATEVEGGWACAAKDLSELIGTLDEYSFNYEVDVVGV